jgi:hypothetical protein
MLLYKCYFDGVISKNSNILKGDTEAEPVLNGYVEFLRTVNSILVARKSTILSKEVNLFTTNIDIFIEKALETLELECNDGFSGRFEPSFALSNFKKSHFKRSLQYDNVSEIPTYNLLKLHGSLTWKMNRSNNIAFCTDLAHVLQIQAKAVTPNILLEIDDSANIDKLAAACKGKASDASLDSFLEAYDGLVIVNPTKAKFKLTLLEQTHYELLRIYSNELEKENTILFVMGFSFADEHIQQMTLRAANSNPTLMIFIIGYDSKSATEIRGRFPLFSTRNNNIEVIQPDLDEKNVDRFKYDLATINKGILSRVLQVDSMRKMPAQDRQNPA